MKNFKLTSFRPDIPGIFNEAFILKKHLARFKYTLNTDIVLPPYEVLIHPSSHCNLKCRWCIGANVLNKLARNKQETQLLPSVLSDPDDMEKAILNILSYKKEVGGKIYKVENVSFSGIVGEPLMAKKSFFRAVEILSKNKIRIGLFSNASLLDYELIAVLLKIAYINISLDAGDAKTYAELKYGGNKSGEVIFNRIITNIKKLVKARNESKRELKITVSYILHPKNYRKFYDIVKQLKEIGVDNFKMKQDISGKTILSEKQAVGAFKLLAKVDKLNDDKFKFIKIHRLNTPADRKRCNGECMITDFFAAIGSDGNLYPCNYHPRPNGVVYGNILNDSFQLIWEGEKRKKFKKQLPNICPSVCDPFRNRSNKLFNEIKQYKNINGREKTNELITKIGETI